MKPIEPGQPDIDARYRTILIMWFAICMSVVMFLVLIHFSPVVTAGTQQLALILNCVAFMPVALSFLLKRRLLDQSVQAQRLELVQVAYVLSFALSESAALLGLMSHFLTGSVYYFVAFVFGGLGMLLHFPKKKHLLDASYKKF